MPRKQIKGMAEAMYIYGLRGQRFPVDIAKHETALKVPLEARMTCGPCKTFAERDHIVEHHNNVDNQLELFSSQQFKDN